MYRLPYFFLACAISASPALAADIVQSETFDWNGVYAGVNFSNISSDRDVRLSATDTGASGFPTVIANGTVPDNAPLDLNTTSFGVQAGYNFVSKTNLMFGLEADLQTFPDADFHHSTYLDTYFRDTTQFFGTLRARVGFLASPDLLVYGTAGLAYADGKFEQRSVCDICPPPYDLSDSSESGSVGWVAGVGAEFHLGGNWTSKIEYMHFDLGHRDNTILWSYSDPFLQTTTMSSKIRQAGEIFRLGLNYRF